MHITTAVSAGELYTWLKYVLCSPNLTTILRDATRKLSPSEEFRIDEARRAIYDKEGYFLSVQVSGVETDNQEGVRGILKIIEDIYSPIIKEKMTTKETVTVFLSVQPDCFLHNTLRAEKKKVCVRGELDPTRRGA